MLQNKIYQNFIIEIFKTFIIILFGLSIIALTVRAVNFLDLIVDSGYPVTTYFKYSILNLFGIALKFIPLSFLLALTIFILKHLDDSEFIILWTSGVKKLQIINLFLFVSCLVLIIYLFFSNFLTPFALNKSRQLLNKDQLNSFLPTVRTQQFSDSFKDFTFLVEKKVNNEVKNIFLHDKGNNLRNLSSNTSKTNNTIIVAQNGIVDNKKLDLLNGQIISSKNETTDNEIIKFDQLNIDLSELSTTTIKKPKLQETSTFKLLKCIVSETYSKTKFCTTTEKEILPTLNRRIIIPLYIPVVSLICCLLLIRTNRNFLKKTMVFVYSFSILLFTELAVRYTGINYFVKYFFIVFPFILLFTFYFYLILKFSRESKSI